MVDLVPPALSRRDLFPAGRLDRDTTGLLILTDDGELAHRMLSPKKHVYKLYEAIGGRAGRSRGNREIRRRCGAGGRYGVPACRTYCGKARDCMGNPGGNQGGKVPSGQKMFLAVGRRVLRLKRVRIGGLELDKTLKEGECRELTKEELALIFQGENRRF